VVTTFPLRLSETMVAMVKACFSRHLPQPEQFKYPLPRTGAVDIGFYQGSLGGHLSGRASPLVSTATLNPIARLGNIVMLAGVELLFTGR
jgi:hypothetical protein